MKKRNADCGWLKLSLRIQERLVLDLPDGRAIVMTFEGREGNYLRVGLDLPRDVAVTREADDGLSRSTTRKETR